MKNNKEEGTTTPTANETFRGETHQWTIYNCNWEYGNMPNRKMRINNISEGEGIKIVG